jgi:DNA-binding MarR family transcriptional regulator
MTSEPRSSEPRSSDPSAPGDAPAGNSLAIDGPAYSPGFWLWHATLRWQREIAAALTPFELTHVQFVLLSCAWWLNDHGLVPNQLELARQAGTDVKMTSEVVRKLEAKGLLERETDPRDTRAKRLRITPKGAELALRAIERVEQADVAFFRPVTSSGTSAESVVALLRLLAESPR